MNHKYGDIIDLPHPTSARHPRMGMTERAAQFSPFSALVGYEDAIEESGRLTQREVEPDRDARELLNRQLSYLNDHPGQKVVLTYFCPDKYKEGGAYMQTAGIVKKVDSLRQVLVLQDATIPLGAILDLQTSK